MLRAKMWHIILAGAMLAVPAWVAPAQVMTAQGGASSKVEVEQAWDALVDSAQRRLEIAKADASIVRGIVQDLADFAERYPHTERASVALLSAAGLAARVGDYDVAEQSLGSARGQTRDPKLLQSIDAEMARLSVRLGKPAPALAVDEWVRGRPTTLDELKGKVVLLDIFQIICPGCHRAHPEIVRMQRQYEEDGFEVLGLAVAFELHGAQTPEKIRRYVDRKAYPYPVALDKGLIETFQRYGARGTPYTVLIDRQGRIRYLDFFRLGSVESMIRQLLNEDVAR